MKYKEIISSSITNTTYNPIDILINKWISQNPNITIHKTHYQLTASNETFRSSVLIEYTEEDKSKNVTHFPAGTPKKIIDKFTQLYLICSTANIERGEVFRLLVLFDDISDMVQSGNYKQAHKLMNKELLNQQKP